MRSLQSDMGGRTKRSQQRRPRPLREEATEADFRFRPLDLQQLVGEAAYVCQPVAHLAAAARFGRDTWKPWVASLGCDILRWLSLK